VKKTEVKSASATKTAPAKKAPAPKTEPRTEAPETEAKKTAEPKEGPVAERFPDCAVIKLLVTTCPSKIIHYQKYRDGMTVAEYIIACGSRKIAIHRLSSDSRRKIIEVK